MNDQKLQEILELYKQGVRKKVVDLYKMMSSKDKVKLTLLVDEDNEARVRSFLLMLETEM